MGRHPRGGNCSGSSGNNNSGKKKSGGIRRRKERARWTLNMPGATKSQLSWLGLAGVIAAAALLVMAALSVWAPDLVTVEPDADAAADAKSVAYPWLAHAQFGPPPPADDNNNNNDDDVNANATAGPLPYATNASLTDGLPPVGTQYRGPDYAVSVTSVTLDDDGAIAARHGQYTTGLADWIYDPAAGYHVPAIHERNGTSHTVRTAHITVTADPVLCGYWVGTPDSPRANFESVVPVDGATREPLMDGGGWSACEASYDAEDHTLSLGRSSGDGTARYEFSFTYDDAANFWQSEWTYGHDSGRDVLVGWVHEVRSEEGGSSIVPAVEPPPSPGTSAGSSSSSSSNSSSTGPRGAATAGAAGAAGPPAYIIGGGLTMDLMPAAAHLESVSVTNGSVLRPQYVDRTVPSGGNYTIDPVYFTASRYILMPLVQTIGNTACGGIAEDEIRQPQWLDIKNPLSARLHASYTAAQNRTGCSVMVFEMDNPEQDRWRYDNVTMYASQIMRLGFGNSPVPLPTTPVDAILDWRLVDIPYNGDPDATAAYREGAWGKLRNIDTDDNDAAQQLYLLIPADGVPQASTRASDINANRADFVRGPLRDHMQESYGLWRDNTHLSVMVRGPVSTDGRDASWTYANPGRHMAFGIGYTQLTERDIRASFTTMVDVDGTLSVPPRQLTPGTLLRLDGTGSTAGNGYTVSSYLWRANGAPAIALSNTDTAYVVVPPGRAGTLTSHTFSAELRVLTQDAIPDTAEASYLADARNQQLSTADAGPDQTVMSNTRVTLNGTGSAAYDSSGTISSYRWFTGDDLPLDRAGTATPSLITPIVTRETTYDILLHVRDNSGRGSLFDRMTLTVLPRTNSPPVADAGDPQTVASGATVTLDGTGSTDSDGSIASYAWTAPSGITLSSTTAASPTFTAPTVRSNTEYVFSLTVTDDDGTASSTADTVTITVTPPAANRPPVADAGDPQTVRSGATVTLDGTGSTDPDGRITEYVWLAPQGISLSGATMSTATFTAPTVSEDTEYTFTLRVIDTDTASDTDSVTITVRPPNRPPVADAGPPQTVQPGDTVTLDGTGSTDSDGSIASYAWTAPAAITLSSTTVQSPTFTAPDVDGTTAATYRFSLTVTDNEGAASDPDTVTITVRPPADIPTVTAAEWYPADGTVTIYFDRPTTVTAAPGTAGTTAVISGAAPSAVTMTLADIGAPAPGAAITTDPGGLSATFECDCLRVQNVGPSVPAPPGTWTWNGLILTSATAIPDQNGNTENRAISAVESDNLQPVTIRKPPPALSVTGAVEPREGVLISWARTPHYHHVERYDGTAGSWQSIRDAPAGAASYTDSRPPPGDHLRYRVWHSYDAAELTARTHCAALPVPAAAYETVLVDWPLCGALRTAHGPSISAINTGASDSHYVPQYRTSDGSAAHGMLSIPTRSYVISHWDDASAGGPVPDTYSVSFVMRPNAADTTVNDMVFEWGNNCGELAAGRPAAGSVCMYRDGTTFRAVIGPGTDSDGSPTVQRTVSAPNVQSPNAYRIALVVDAAAGTASIYRDGVLASTATGTMPANRAALTDAGTIHLGRHESVTIGEFRIYGSALTAAQVADAGTGRLDVSALAIRPPLITDLRATAVNSTIVDLDWSRPEYAYGGLTGYRIWFGTGGSFAGTTVTTTMTPDITSYRVENLHESTTYSFRVGAVTPIGAGTSNLARAATSFAEFDPGALTLDHEEHNIGSIVIRPYGGDVPVSGMGGVADPESLAGGTNNPASGPDGVTLIEVSYAPVDQIGCVLDYLGGREGRQIITVDRLSNMTTIEMSNGNTKTEMGTVYATPDGRDNTVFRYPNTGPPARIVCTDGISEASYDITTEIPLLGFVDDFQNGRFGTQGTLGSLDMVYVVVVTLGMIGFSRVNLGAGVIVMVMVTGAMAHFQLIEFPIAVTGVIATVLVLAVVTVRKWGGAG